MSAKLPALLLFLILTLLSACGSETAATITPVPPTATTALLPTVTPTANPTPTPAMPQGWESRWLRGIPCAPPCWEGVTPGITSVETAQGVWSKNSLFSQVSPPSATFPTLGFVSWKWSNGIKGGQAEYNPENPQKPILRISPRYSNSFKLANIISAYGDPSHVIASPPLNPDMNGPRILGYYVEFVYIKQGFSISVISPNIPNINKEIVLDNLVFFESGLDKHQII